MSTLWKLLALVACLLMPFGMANAATTVQHEPQAQSDHCSGRGQPADAPAHPQLHCAACAALPAIEAPSADAIALPSAAVELPFVQVFSGIDPETATPPPKSA
jgi:hypothetical protein